MGTKPELRAAILARRAGRSDGELAAAGAALAAQVPDRWLTATAVAAYAAVDTEPPTRVLLDRLHAAGVRVLLPVVDGERLGWAAYAGWEALEPGRFGLLQPVGLPDPAGLRDVDEIVVPALAVDRAGHRLGRGGGYYDRALRAVPVRATAVVFDEEILDRVPAEPHDVTVGAVLSPSRWSRLGAAGAD